MKKTILSLAIIALLGVIGIATFIYSGAYNIGADEPHWTATVKLMETVRERSVMVRASKLTVPDLNDRQLVLKGAGQYAAMCVECHLAPGKKDSEIRPGLYPQPPNLALMRIDPRVAFWAVKHGIKMSGMPAWGTGHDDVTLWSIVAFVNKLPDLTPQEYKDIVDKAPPDEEMDSMKSGKQEAADAQSPAHTHTHAHAHAHAHADGNSPGPDKAMRDKMKMPSDSKPK